MKIPMMVMIASIWTVYAACHDKKPGTALESRRNQRFVCGLVGSNWGVCTVSNVKEFPLTSVTLKYNSVTDQLIVDYRHVKTQEQLAAMFGGFVSDLLSEDYLGPEDALAIVNVAIAELQAVKGW